MQMAALYESITRSIIDDLEKGVPAWVQPWRTKRRTALGLLPANLATGRTYSGINIPILWHAAKSAGYPDPAWMTYRQALALDANVRKGEKGTHIVFTRKLTVKKEEDEERQISMLRSYTVFNVAQIDGLPPTIVTPEDAPPLLDDNAQRFIEATRADSRMRSARRKALLRCSVQGSRTPARLQYRPRQGLHRRIEHRHLQHALKRVSSQRGQAIGNSFYSLRFAKPPLDWMVPNGSATGPAKLTSLFGDAARPKRYVLSRQIWRVHSLALTIS